MENWMDELTAALGEESLSRDETDRLLRVAREVAHRVERKVTPLAAFVLGCAVGRSLARGTSRADAVSRAIASLERLLPGDSRET